MASFSPQLSCRLPARVQGYPWRLAYSTVKHGTSLKTLYRSLVDVDSPVLLVIKDTDNRVCFGSSHRHFSQTGSQMFKCSFKTGNRKSLFHVMTYICVFWFEFSSVFIL